MRALGGVDRRAAGNAYAGNSFEKKKANGGILEGKREEKERLSPGKHGASRQENGKACEPSSSSLFLLQKEEEP